CSTIPGASPRAELSTGPSRLQRRGLSPSLLSLLVDGFDPFVVVVRDSCYLPSSAIGFFGLEKLTPHAEVASVGVVSETSFEGYIASQRVVSLGFGSFYSLPGILHDGFLQGDHDDVGDDEEGDTPGEEVLHVEVVEGISDRKSTRLNSSHVKISYAVFCLKKKRN